MAVTLLNVGLLPVRVFLTFVASKIYTVVYSVIFDALCLMPENGILALPPVRVFLTDVA